MSGMHKFRHYVYFVFILCATSGVSYASESIHYEFVPSSRSIMRVGQNQSLDVIIKQIYPQNEDLWPRIKEEIERINPQAFNQYSGRLMAGQRLQLVTVKKIREQEIKTVRQAGRISTVKGYAVVTDKRGKEGRLMENSLVYEGDRLVTSRGAELVVKMVDGAELRVKQDSAVRITHLPTNIVVQCQNERSQHKNRATAWKMLRAQMARHEEEQREAEEAAKYQNQAKTGFGSQIRNYFLHPDQRVKDARTKFQMGNFQAVLDGDIQGFLDSVLRWRAGQPIEDGDA